MAEKFPASFEHNREPEERHEVTPSHEQSTEKQSERIRHEPAEKIDSIRAAAEAEADKNKLELDTLTKAAVSENQRPMIINRELKNMAYSRTMHRIRQKLPAPAKAFSKVIHQPAVDAVSESLGKTVARPSGILAGGICAFLGSSIFLWVSRHYGYEYNFLLFALLFLGGFCVGLLIELVLRLVRNNKA